MANVNIYNMADTWNDGATTFTAIKMNVTDTASDSASLLMDLQVGGVSKFKVAKGGAVTMDGGNLTVGNDLFLKFGVGANINFNLGSGNWGTIGRGVSPYAIRLTTGSSSNYTFEQMSGTNAQTFNIYNTYTDPSNHERGFMRWNSNVLEIGTEALGTGSNRNIEFKTAGTTRLTIDTSGHTRVTAGRQLFFGASVFAQELSGQLRLGGGSVELLEITPPSTPSVNSCRFYAKDNGSGKTQLVVLMPDGIETVLATET